MKKHFQQKEVCKIVGLQKQRIEYLMMKVNIEPEEQAQGTGTINLFNFGNIFEFDIADCLSMWGFTFKKIQQILKTIKQAKPDLFLYDSEDGYFLPPIKEQVFLFRVGVSTKRKREKDFQSSLEENQILTGGDILKDESLQVLFQKPYGTLFLNLSARKAHICTSLDLIGP